MPQADIVGYSLKSQECSLNEPYMKECLVALTKGML